MNEFFIRNIRNITIYVLRFELETKHGKAMVMTDRRMLDKCEEHNFETIFYFDHKIEKMFPDCNYNEIFSMIINDILNRITPLNKWIRLFQRNSAALGAITI